MPPNSPPTVADFNAAIENVFALGANVLVTLASVLAFIFFAKILWLCVVERDWMSLMKLTVLLFGLQVLAYVFTLFVAP